MCGRFSLLLVPFLGLAVAGTEASAQQVAVGASNQALSDGYFERSGLQWGLGLRQGSFGLAVPPFGGYTPGAGLTVGGSSGNGALGLDLSQGSRRTYTSQSATMLAPNGIPGFVVDNSWSPFVIGNVPVVGGFPIVTSMMPAMPQASASPAGNAAVQQALQQARTNQPTGSNDPGIQPQAVPKRTGAAPMPMQHLAEASADPAAKLTAAQASSAGRAVPSVAEAKRARQAEQAHKNTTARSYLERGQEAEQAGKPSVARVYYQMAARHAEGALKAEAISRLTALQPAVNPAQ